MRRAGRLSAESEWFGDLSPSLFRYVWGTSRAHQLPLVVLNVGRVRARSGAAGTAAPRCQRPRQVLAFCCDRLDRRRLCRRRAAAGRNEARAQHLSQLDWRARQALPAPPHLRDRRRHDPGRAVAGRNHRVDDRRRGRADGRFIGSASSSRCCKRACWRASSPTSSMSTPAWTPPHWRSCCRSSSSCR
jgi:hypothetical protein